MLTCFFFRFFVCHNLLILLKKIFCFKRIFYILFFKHFLLTFCIMNFLCFSTANTCFWFVETFEMSSKSWKSWRRATLPAVAIFSINFLCFFIYAQESQAHIFYFVSKFLKKTAKKLLIINKQKQTMNSNLLSLYLC